MAGHFLPLMDLLIPLKQDHNFTVYTTSSRRNEVIANGFQFEPLSTYHDDEDINTLAYSTNQLNLVSSFKTFKQVAKLLTTITSELIVRIEADLIIADMMLFTAQYLSDKTGIPLISAFPIPFVSQGYDATPTFLRIPYSENKVINKLANQGLKRGKDLMFLGCKPYLPKDFHLWHENQKRPLLEYFYSRESIVAYGIKSLEFRTDLPKQLTFIGYPLTKTEHTSHSIGNTVNFLDYKKVVLVTSGTLVKWSKDYFRNVAKAIATQYPNFLVIFTEGTTKKISQLDKNLYTCSYIPYDTYLPNIDYVIHHGAAGIFYKAIANTIPSLIIPMDFDQYDFAKRADYFQVGIYAKNRKLKTVLDAFQNLITTDWPNLPKYAKEVNNTPSSLLLAKEIDRLTQ